MKENFMKRTLPAQKTCPYCGDHYIPYIRAAETQESCSKTDCRKKRQRKAYKYGEPRTPTTSRADWRRKLYAQKRENGSTVHLIPAETVHFWTGANSQKAILKQKPSQPSTLRPKERPSAPAAFHTGPSNTYVANATFWYLRNDIVNIGLNRVNTT